MAERERRVISRRGLAQGALVAAGVALFGPACKAEENIKPELLVFSEDDERRKVEVFLYSEGDSSKGTYVITTKEGFLGEEDYGAIVLGAVLIDINLEVLLTFSRVPDSSQHRFIATIGSPFDVRTADTWDIYLPAIDFSYPHISRISWEDRRIKEAIFDGVPLSPSPANISARLV